MHVVFDVNSPTRALEGPIALKLAYKLCFQESSCQPSLQEKRESKLQSSCKKLQGKSDLVPLASEFLWDVENPFLPGLEAPSVVTAGPVGTGAVMELTLRGSWFQGKRKGDSAFDLVQVFSAFQSQVLRMHLYCSLCK